MTELFPQAAGTTGSLVAQTLRGSPEFSRECNPTWKVSSPTSLMFTRKSAEPVSVHFETACVHETYLPFCCASNQMFILTFVYHNC